MYSMHLNAHTMNAKSVIRSIIIATHQSSILANSIHPTHATVRQCIVIHQHSQYTSRILLHPPSAYSFHNGYHVRLSALSVHQQKRSKSHGFSHDESWRNHIVIHQATKNHAHIHMIKLMQSKLSNVNQWR
eukprot:258467_1